MSLFKKLMDHFIFGSGEARELRDVPRLEGGTPYEGVNAEEEIDLKDLEEIECAEGWDLNKLVAERLMGYELVKVREFPIAQGMLTSRGSPNRALAGVCEDEGVAQFRRVPNWALGAYSVREVWERLQGKNGFTFTMTYRACKRGPFSILIEKGGMRLTARKGEKEEVVTLKACLIAVLAEEALEMEEEHESARAD